MKTIFFSIFLLSCPILYAQNLKVIGIVDYNFVHILDSNDRNIINQENMRLFITPDVTVYRNLDKLKFDSSLETKFNNAAKANSNEPINFGIIPKGSGYIFYNAFKKNAFATSRKFLNNTYFINDTTSINWTITQDTLTYLGYASQVATCQFKGRFYTAYFTKDIAYPVGPWKLRGLPGLILKVFDLKKEVIIEATNVDFKSHYADIIYPDNIMYASQKELSTAMAAYRQNPQSFGEGSPIQITQKNSNVSKQPKTKVANPVELAP